MLVYNHNVQVWMFLFVNQKKNQNNLQTKTRCAHLKIPIMMCWSNDARTYLWHSVCILFTYYLINVFLCVCTTKQGDNPRALALNHLIIYTIPMSLWYLLLAINKDTLSWCEIIVGLAYTKLTFYSKIGFTIKNRRWSFIK